MKTRRQILLHGRNTVQCAGNDVEDGARLASQAAGCMGLLLMLTLEDDTVEPAVERVVDELTTASERLRTAAGEIDRVALWLANSLPDSPKKGA